MSIMQNFSTRHLVLICSCILSCLSYWMVCSMYEGSRINTLPKLRHFQGHFNKPKRWIVVRTVYPPSASIKYLASLEGWKVVVIGDLKTPSNWSYANCTFLNLTDQSNLSFEVVKFLPTSSYGRKIIGYLYAIANGAEVVYETDDTNQVNYDLTKFTYTDITFGMRYEGTGLFNPYIHFGQPSLWPKGYPLEKVGEPNNVTYTVSSFKTPYIQHGLVNGDSDVDMLSRLTKKTLNSKIMFDEMSPRVSLSHGAFSPFNSQNTLFLYDALWAMVLPTTTSPPVVADIWRGFWAQCLLRELDGTLAFYPPKTIQSMKLRTSETHFKGKPDLFHIETNKLITFLTNWKCKREFRFFQCVTLLSLDMVKENFWKKEDSELINVWLNDLKKVGYIEPVRKPYGLTKHNKNYSKCLFQPSKHKYANSNNPIAQAKWTQVIGITRFCNDTNYQININSIKSITYPNILLIVVFNFPIYDNIPFLQLMYGVMFSHIVYCGNDIQAFKTASVHFEEPVTFLEVDVNRGYFAYRCITESMKMNFGVKGYLMIGDDTLLNSWNTPSLPFDKIWFMEASPLSMNKVSGWHWWNGVMGRTVFNKTWSKLMQLSTDDEQMGSAIKKFMTTLQTNTGSKFGLYHFASDIIYIPTKYKDSVIFLMDLFSKYKVFLEIVLPTIVYGLDSRDSIFKLPGQYLWYDGKRDHVPQLFNSNHIFLHPVKLSLIKTKLKPFFCSVYFPLTLTPKRVNLIK